MVPLQVRPMPMTTWGECSYKHNKNSHHNDSNDSNMNNKKKGNNKLNEDYYRSNKDHTKTYMMFLRDADAAQ